MPRRSISVSASGRTTLALECQAFSDEITFCSGGSSETGPGGGFPGNVTGRGLLPPYALGDPLPTAASCTVASVVAPEWRFSDVEATWTGPTGGSGSGGEQVGTVRFGLELGLDGAAGEPGQPTERYPSTVANSGVRLSPLPGGAEPAWHVCALESIGEPSLAPTSCSFWYEPASHILGLELDWRCSDLDADSP